ncbi:MAG: type 1 glutamine amidotransferase [Chloroflexi bacterium]|nr:type 1 glutamine amidotransferase [Chloroflexota bacterium]
MKPRIGFTSREANRQYFITWQRDYWFSIRLGGGEPVRLYPEVVKDADEALAQLDGLLLTGGGDVDPQIYQQALNGTDPHTIYPERDRMEMALVQAAIARNMPVFGICRGIQVINVALGGGLTQHIEGHTGKNNTFDAPRPHSVTVRPHSLLDRIMDSGLTIQVNSYHHQAVCSHDLADALIATGIASDGVIEALEHPVHPWLLGVQWHPERLYELDASHERLFTTFVQAAHHYHLSRSPA